MRELILTNRFKKSLSKYIKRHPYLKDNIYNVIELMSEDVYSPSLSTHKLSGELYGLRASSCGFDCRIIFSIEKDINTNREVIILLDIGTHDEIY